MCHLLCGFVKLIVSTTQFVYFFYFRVFITNYIIIYFRKDRCTAGIICDRKHCVEYNVCSFMSSFISVMCTRLISELQLTDLRQIYHKYSIFLEITRVHIRRLRIGVENLKVNPLKLVKSWTIQAKW